MVDEEPIYEISKKQSHLFIFLFLKRRTNGLTSLEAICPHIFFFKSGGIIIKNKRAKKP